MIFPAFLWEQVELGSLYIYCKLLYFCMKTNTVAYDICQQWMLDEHYKDFYPYGHNAYVYVCWFGDVNNEVYVLSSCALEVQNYKNFIFADFVFNK